MNPRIEILSEKKLVGTRLKMSFAANRTRELWQSLMPRLKEIKTRVGNDKFSMQIYEDPLSLSDAAREFEKWAAVEVSGFDDVPEGLETFTLRGGLYAVFDYKGSSTDNRVFLYIFTEWLPICEYALDARPHFEVLGENYRNGDPESEEEIWIPVKPK